MISFDKNFILLHPPKTGGTSIAEALIDHTENTRHYRNHGPGDFEILNPNLTHHKIHKHTIYPVYKELVPNIKDFYTIMMMRNPWDRVVSWYFHGGVMCQHSHIRKGRMETIIAKRTFFEFCGGDWDNIDTYFMFEQYEKSAKEIFEKIGVDVTLIPHLNKGRRKRDYRRYLPGDLPGMIARRYAIDIETFGYSFDDAKDY